MAIVPDLARPWLPVDPRISPAPGVTNARQARAIVPSDSLNIDPRVDAIYVGVSGDIAITPNDNVADTVVIFKAVPVGWFPVKCRRIWATGTTATDLVGAVD